MVILFCLTITMYSHSIKLYFLLIPYQPLIFSLTVERLECIFSLILTFFLMNLWLSQLSITINISHHTGVHSGFIPNYSITIRNDYIYRILSRSLTQEWWWSYSPRSLAIVIQCDHTSKCRITLFISLFLK